MLQKRADRNQVKQFRQYRLEHFNRIGMERQSFDWLKEMDRYEESYETNRSNDDLWRLDDDGNYPEVL